jgi:hypothetical protein
MSPTPYAPILDLALRIANDFKLLLTSKYRVPATSWLKGTALEDVGGIEEFFSTARNVSSHAGGIQGLSFASHGDVRLFEVATMFRLPATTTLESKLLACLSLFAFHPPFAAAICGHDMHLLPAIIKEYGFWTTDPHVAKIIVRVFGAVGRSAGQVCVDELSNAGALHLLCKAVTNENGGHALKVAALSPVNFDVFCSGV